MTLPRRYHVQLMEKSTNMTFIGIDLERVYVAVTLNLQWKGEKHLETINKYWENVISENVSCVNTSPNLSDAFIPQGCCLSTTLFKLYSRSFLKQFARKCGYILIEIDWKYLAMKNDDQDLTGIQWRRTTKYRYIRMEPHKNEKDSTNILQKRGKGKAIIKMSNSISWSKQVTKSSTSTQSAGTADLHPLDFFRITAECQNYWTNLKKLASNRQNRL